MAYDFEQLEQTLLSGTGYTKIYALHDGTDMVKNNDREFVDKDSLTTKVYFKKPGGAYSSHNQDTNLPSNGKPVLLQTNNFDGAPLPIRNQAGNIVLTMMHEQTVANGVLATILVGP